tara:strand:+ start:1161 stop:2048 length:888 start_codon:yes stop_codon:yes gene_type:complete
MFRDRSGAIVYISGSERQDIVDLRRSLKLLEKNFNSRFQYPIIIFHEGFPERVQRELKRGLESQVRFEKITLSVPVFLDEDEIVRQVEGKPWSIGYLNMIRWCSIDFFLHPAMDDFDWYWHFDTDSFLIGKVDYDVFKFMEENNLLYGYQTMMKESDYACESFWETTEHYVSSRGIRPTFLKKHMNGSAWDQSYYYADFEISRLDFWRSDQYRDYFDYIDKTGGIYRYRWGDTLIHTMAVFMFMDEKQTHQFTDLDWRHQGYVNDNSFLKIQTLRRNIWRKYRKRRLVGKLVRNT